MVEFIQAYWIWIVLGIAVLWFLSRGHGGMGHGTGEHGSHDQGVSSQRRRRGC